MQCKKSIISSPRKLKVYPAGGKELSNERSQLVEIPCLVGFSVFGIKRDKKKQNGFQGHRVSGTLRKAC